MRDALPLDQLKNVYGRIAKRYDVEHGLITAKSDQRGRTLLVNKAVGPGDKVLDCGAGTGTTGIMAARKAGPDGEVALFDLSEAMLVVARHKVDDAGLQDRVSYQAGDAVHLPYRNGEFDVVLSTYSMCPLYDPGKGALELYRVTRPGGKIGVAHSTQPSNRFVKWLADQVEDWAWHFPSLSMGCRSVEVLPALINAGGKLLFSRHIGIPLWPFLVFVIEKPAA